MKLSEWLRPPLTQAQIATELRVSQGLVSHWVTGRRPVTPELVLSLAALTGFRVRPHDLRPDLYPSPLDGLPDRTQPEPDMERAA